MQPSLLKYMPSRVSRRNVREPRPGTEREGGTLHVSNSKQCGSQQYSTTEDIINSILPPREWTEGGEVWAQSVSSTPATTADVLALQEELDKRLRVQKAKTYGICPIREELYSQCFDEVLRQVTIQCAERGLLLNRVRWELRSLINAHRRVYESSAAFGVRKALLTQAKRDAEEASCAQLDQENARLIKEIKEARADLENMTRAHDEKLAAENQEHEANVAALRRKYQKVKHEVERILSTVQRT